MEELIPTIYEEGEERIDTVQESTIIAGVQTINGKAGDLDLKTINNTDLLTSGNINLATPTDIHNLDTAKQDKLVAGTNIQIAADGKTISATDTTYSAGSGLNLTGTTFSVDTDTIATQNDIYTLQTTKQDNLTTTQLNAVNSGIDSTKVAQIATNEGDIATINGKIPTQASTSNQLADKNFVNSSVQTATANYRGSWDDWASVPTQASDYPEDYAGSHTPTVNDYLVVQDASDYTEETLEGTWRFKYAGNWDDNGKAGWLPEYQVNETPMTAAQIAAINSGITDTLVAQISTNQSNIADLTSNKLDKATTFWGQTAQNGAVQGTLTLTESGQNAIIATSGHNTTDAGIKMGNTKNYVEAGVSAITLSSNTGNIQLKPKSGSSVDVMSSKITNLATPTANTDASTKKYVDDGLATKQNTLTAGTNIQISGDTISATDTTYTAGSGLTLAGTQFSVTEPVPTGFFTDTAPIAEGEGTAITLNNTVDAPIDNVELKGDTYQKTYSGKNLLNIVDDTYTPGAGGTITCDGGVVSVSGSNVGQSATGLTNYFTCKAGNTYTLSAHASMANTGVIIRLYRQNGPSRLVWLDTADAYNSFSFTEDENVRLEIRLSNGTSFASGFYLKPQLELGSTHTDWEQYVGGTASPNPDYPQQIDTVTGEQTVSVVGKNLFDKDSANVTNGYLSSSNGTFVAGGDSYATNNAISLTAGDYVASRALEKVCHYAMDGSYVGVITRTGSNNEKFAMPSNGYVRLQFASPFDANTFQLEHGSTATTFQPYQSQTYKVNLGKNLFDKDNANVLNAYINASAVITANAPDRTVWLKINKNTTYTVSFTQKALSTATSADDFAIGVYASQLQIGSSGTRLAHEARPSATSDYTFSYTFNSGDNEYVAIKVANTSKTDFNATLATLQLELGSTATTYSAYFAPIELCKIGTYQDYIWKDGSDWKVHKAIGKVVLDGTEAWGGAAYGSCYRYNVEIAGAKDITKVADYVGISDHFYFNTGVFGADTIKVGMFGQYIKQSNIIRAYFASAETTAGNFRTWLGSNNTTVVFPLETPTDTTITDANLISQLEALADSTTYAPQTDYNTSTPSPNLPTILTIDVFKNNYAGLLARLNKAGA